MVRVSQPESSGWSSELENEEEELPRQEGMGMAIKSVLKNKELPIKERMRIAMSFVFKYKELEPSIRRRMRIAISSVLKNMELPRKERMRMAMSFVFKYKPLTIKQRKRIAMSFVFKSKEKELPRHERKRIAMANFDRRSKNRTAFDAIASPEILHLGGGVRPLYITKSDRRCLNKLSEIALEKYNGENNQDQHYEFVEVVKSTIACTAGPMYYITFKAKAKQEDSNTPFIIFQAQVWKKLTDPPEVMSCAIKT